MRLPVPVVNTQLLCHLVIVLSLSLSIALCKFQVFFSLLLQIHDVPSEEPYPNACRDRHFKHFKCHSAAEAREGRVENIVLISPSSKTMFYFFAHTNKQRLNKVRRKKNIHYIQKQIVETKLETFI